MYTLPVVLLSDRKLTSNELESIIFEIFEFPENLSPSIVTKSYPDSVSKWTDEILTVSQSDEIGQFKYSLWRRFL